MKSNEAKKLIPMPTLEEVSAADKVYEFHELEPSVEQAKLYDASAEAFKAFRDSISKEQYDLYLVFEEMELRLHAYIEQKLYEKGLIDGSIKH